MAGGQALPLGLFPAQNPFALDGAPIIIPVGARIRPPSARLVERKLQQKGLSGAPEDSEACKRGKTPGGLRLFLEHPPLPYQQAPAPAPVCPFGRQAEAFLQHPGGIFYSGLLHALWQPLWPLYVLLFCRHPLAPFSLFGGIWLAFTLLGLPLAFYRSRGRKGVTGITGSQGLPEPPVDHTPVDISEEGFDVSFPVGHVVEKIGMLIDVQHQEGEATGDLP